jgi:hypothetical protein
MTEALFDNGLQSWDNCKSVGELEVEKPGVGKVKGIREGRIHGGT